MKSGRRAFLNQAGRSYCKLSIMLPRCNGVGAISAILVFGALLHVAMANFRELPGLDVPHQAHHRQLTGSIGHPSSPPPTPPPTAPPAYGTYAGHSVAPPPSPIPPSAIVGPPVPPDSYASPPPTDTPQGPPSPAIAGPPSPAIAGPPSPSPIGPPSPSPAYGAGQPSPPPNLDAPTAPPPSYGDQASFSPPPAPMSPPPPPGANRLPPGEVAILGVSDGTQVTSGVGLVQLRPFGGDTGLWSYVCADPWAGFDTAAANVACRQAGFSGGGDPMRVWRSEVLPPMLVGNISCSGFESSLSSCVVSGATGMVAGIDAWTMGVDASQTTGVCQMLAGVRCRTGSSLVLRAATSPSPSDTVTTAGNNVTVRVIRLEASVSNGRYGAICRDGGFDNNTATVACRSMNYNGGFVYQGPATGNLPPGTQDPTMDAQGSFLGTATGLKCSGTESHLNSCAGWRSSSTFVPCRAAAWVACTTTAAA